VSRSASTRASRLDLGSNAESGHPQLHFTRATPVTPWNHSSRAINAGPRFYVDESLLPVGRARALVRRDVTYPGHRDAHGLALGGDREPVGADWLLGQGEWIRC